MRNLRMTIAFDGTKYKGWQKQKDTDLTIQGKIEAVLSKMTNEEVTVVGCGRTDAGVHAENYIANFHTKSIDKPKKILAYLYEFLPEDIVVKSMEEVSERFHARYNVKSKTYVYTINNQKFRDVFSRKFVYHLADKLDWTEINTAAEYLIGTHDFQSFTNARGDKSTIRTIHAIEITDKNGIIEIKISGDGFLWNMVRIIVGTLIDVGLGKLRPIDVQNILNEKKRWEAGPLAPAKGLCLKNTEY